MSSYGQLQSLVGFILPEDILDNSNNLNIKHLEEEFYIHLDEQLILPMGYSAATISSNGFSPESQVHPPNS